MDDFFGKDELNGLSDFTEPKKEDKRPSEYNPESRRKKVENFVVHIEEFDDDPVEPQMKKHDTVSNRPQAKGEIYFTNYQRQRPWQETPESQTGRRTTSGDLDMFRDSDKRHREPQDKPVSKTPEKKSRKKKKRKLTPEELKKLRDTYSRTFYIAMVCVLIFTVILSTVGIQCVNDAIALSVSEEEIEVTIPDGITTSEVIDLFKEKGLINVSWFSKLFAAFRGYDEEGIYYYVNGEQKLQPYVGGTYYLSSSMGIEGMLNIVLDNTHNSEKTVTVTFPEGYTSAKIFGGLVDADVLSEKDKNKFVSSINYNYNHNYPFLDKKNKDLPIALEGFLFPDTYEMFEGESTASIVKRMLDNFAEKWTDKYDKRAKELGYTTREIITIASIIQKEAANKSQMADISSVIHNRLDNSLNFPTIQSDATVLYATVHLENLLGANKANQYVDRYDTYTCMGLPEGPICNPGIDAIEAALYPSDTNYYYFCHNKVTGEMYLATNYSDAVQNEIKAGLR